MARTPRRVKRRKIGLARVIISGPHGPCRYSYFYLDNVYTAARVTKTGNVVLEQNEETHLITSPMILLDHEIDFYGERSDVTSVPIKNWKSGQ